MKVVDIFDGNKKLIERVSFEDLEFNPQVDNVSMLKYAKEAVYEDAYRNYMCDQGIQPSDRNKYYDNDMADRYAAKEADYSSYKIKEVNDRI